MQATRRLRCFLVGSESLLIQCAEILLERGHEIVGVASRRPPIREWAQGRGIPCVGGHDEIAAVAGDDGFDWLFSITNFAVLPPEVLALPGEGAVNFHDGPVETHAGLNTPAWGLMQGETTWAITWHRMAEQVDAGEILVQEPVPIEPGDTALTLNARCYEAGIRSFPTLIDGLVAGDLEERAQDTSRQRFFAATDRPGAAGLLLWSRPAAELVARVGALDYGPYANPLARAKILVAGKPWLVGWARLAEGQDRPGTLLAVHQTEWTVAAVEGAVTLGGFSSLAGEEISAAELAARHGMAAGSRLESPSDESIERLDALARDAAKSEAFWRRRWLGASPASGPESEPGPGESMLLEPTPGQREFLAASPDRAVALIALYLARRGAASPFLVGLSEPGTRHAVAGCEEHFATRLPLRVRVDPDAGFASFEQALGAELERVRRRAPHARDLFVRDPQLRDDAVLPVLIRIEDDGGSGREDRGRDLTVSVRQDGSFLWAAPCPVGRLVEQFRALLDHVIADPRAPVGRLSLLGDDERRRVLEEWNATERDYPQDACIHQLFERQAMLTPDAPALTCDGQSRSYRELNERANALAHHLQSLGVARGDLVAVCTERGVDMVASVLATMKTGAAYVPVDPSYPAERIELMLEDCGAAWILADRHGSAAVADARGTVVQIDDRQLVERRRVDNPVSDAEATDLAYVIYTSGSTGRPKGVMVEHRNVVNFFVAMDERIPHEPAGVWLAVTSLSFDISVLELLWTLGRGFHVVIHAEDRKAQPAGAPRARTAHPGRSIDFGLFYFASDEGEHASDKYRLLLEGARFADRHGFSSVWTPERHFHAFGGLYPNPSVAAAAIASITERVRILAGSCVLPLHHPIRVAEEWSLVDNLSGGRVGISFASGWQPDDFVLNPANYADAKQAMVRDIEIVRRLWRGETMTFEGPKGPVELRTLPRPIQPELPFWITTAGNPETFRIAGAQGAHLLTHLLGQSVEELAAKLEVYRRAWRDAGHAGSGIVSLMLHTFVAEDGDFVRDQVREPMKSYLRSSASLIRQYASTFPAFKKISGEGSGSIDLDFQEMSDEDMEALLEHSFLRYYETSGLFGTPESCVAMVDRLKEIDVDEIACLIDFGVPSAIVLDNLVYLDELRRRCEGIAAPAQDDHSVAALILRHGVTHLQCTPSMATMLLGDPAARAALGRVRHLYVGGEALPPALATQLRGAGEATIDNMYGPTETTVWSATHRVSSADEHTVPIGRPVANTRLYVLDPQLQPVPPGATGELFIGGDGVVRGYLGQDELTRERFLPDPFGKDGGRMYRTGDRVRWTAEGELEFLGRLDTQIKIRGYRVELGEIEARLRAEPEVREAAAVLREDVPGDRRIVAYVVPSAAGRLSVGELREAMKRRLPEFMVPAAYVALDALPLTPNKKVDRKALPAPDRVESVVRSAYVSPENELETGIAEVWQRVLDVPRVGANDNFFDLGGHSLLVVQVLRRLREVVGRELAMTDLFRFPTVRSLAAYLSDGQADEAALAAGRNRAGLRRQAMGRRRRRRA